MQWKRGIFIDPLDLKKIKDHYNQIYANNHRDEIEKFFGKHNLPSLTWEDRESFDTILHTIQVGLIIRNISTKPPIIPLINSIEFTKNKYYNLTKTCTKMREEETLANLMYAIIVTQVPKLDKDGVREDDIGWKKSSDINWIQHLKRKYTMVKLCFSLEGS